MATTPFSGDVDVKLIYRTTVPAEGGFANAEDEREAIYEHIQGLSETAGPDEIMDTLLVMVNICAMRAILYSPNARMSDWYLHVSDTIRKALGDCTRSFARPNVMLEDATLYYPDSGIAH
jgi:hypothetical protein